jgi:hypothetical protein
MLGGLDLIFGLGTTPLSGLAECANRRGAAANEVKVIHRKSEQLKGVVILGSVGNGIQLKRFDIHGVLFRGCVGLVSWHVWLRARVEL